MKRSPRIILFVGCGLVSSLAAVSGSMLQSSADGGALWARSEGAEVVLVGASADPLAVELPAGATLRQLEPAVGGWLAAGRRPDDGGSDLLLIAGGRDGAGLLAVPDRGTARHRGQPALLLSAGALEGLVWAEGERSTEFEIWAASYEAGSWSPTELVSPRAAGSQVAPRGVVLSDGSWLVVWTVFDGGDSEIVWSRRVAGAWTAPEPLHRANDVPDITPDLVRLEGGALAAWSRYDGSDYRLHTARFTDGRWIEVESFGGKGSAEPRFFRADQRILLLFSSVDPASWTLAELDSSGRRHRESLALVDSYERPLLLLDEGQEGLLRWPELDHQLTWQELP